jgi:hypothetical protein
MAVKCASAKYTQQNDNNDDTITLIFTHHGLEMLLPPLKADRIISFFLYYRAVRFSTIALSLKVI